MKIKVSDLITRFLEEHGVKHVFLLSGGMMMHLLDSISKSSSIKYVCNHHEQACAMAAEGNARQTGGLGVCFATSGPGATNTITGITGAWLDSSPVLFLTGQSRRTLTARGLGLKDMRMVGTFEVDIVPVVASITKYSVFVDDPNQILYHLEKAVYLALTGRPGPVVLDIPLDVQGGMVEESNLIRFIPPQLTKPPFADISELRSKLASAKRPVILAGHGIRVAAETKRFLRLIDELGIPVVTTQLAKDLVPFDHSFYVGHVGLRGERAANFAVQAADLLIVLGSSLHITTTGYDVDAFAPSAEKVWIDSDAANLARNITKAEVTYRLSVGDFLDLASNLKAPGSASEWSLVTQSWKKELPVVDEHPVKDDVLETYQLVSNLAESLVGGETLVTDAGSLYYVVGQCFKAKPAQRVIISGALGAMGYSLPAAIGASLANPSNVTICLTGDGSMQMNVQELATVACYKPNIKIIVINNGGYASIRNTQVAFCNGNIAGTGSSSGVTMPDWALLCQSYGIPHMKCSKHSELNGSLKTFFSHSGPVFLECVMPEIVEMFPAVTSRKLDDGSFVSSRLHEMSPFLSEQRLIELGITADKVKFMNGV